MQIQQLIEGATGTTTVADAPKFKIDPRRFKDGPIPIQVYDSFVATVTLYGAIATDQEVMENTAVWSPIAGGAFTAAGVDSMFSAATHICAIVSAYTSGTVNCRALI